MKLFWISYVTWWYIHRYANETEIIHLWNCTAFHGSCTCDGRCVSRRTLRISLGMSGLGQDYYVAEWMMTSSVHVVASDQALELASFLPFKKWCPDVNILRKCGHVFVDLEWLENRWRRGPKAEGQGSDVTSLIRYRSVSKWSLGYLTVCFHKWQCWYVL